MAAGYPRNNKSRGNVTDSLAFTRDGADSSGGSKQIIMINSRRGKRPPLDFGSDTSPAEPQLASQLGKKGPPSSSTVKRSQDKNHPSSSSAAAADHRKKDASPASHKLEQQAPATSGQRHTHGQQRRQQRNSVSVDGSLVRLPLLMMTPSSPLSVSSSSLPSSPYQSDTSSLESPLATDAASLTTLIPTRQTRESRYYDVPQVECPPSEDEMDNFACPSPDSHGRFRCIGSHAICDGFRDCPKGEDEDRKACLFYKSVSLSLSLLQSCCRAPFGSPLALPFLLLICCP